MTATVHIMTWPPGEVPCDLCGVYVLPDFLERTPPYCARERMCCAECFDALESEANEEAAISEANGRQRIEEMGVG
jgi:hypothetical protein